MMPTKIEPFTSSRLISHLKYVLYCDVPNKHNVTFNIFQNDQSVSEYEVLVKIAKF